MQVFFTVHCDIYAVNYIMLAVTASTSNLLAGACGMFVSWRGVFLLVVFLLTLFSLAFGLPDQLDGSSETTFVCVQMI